MNSPQEPSAEALAAFRQEAAALDVEDILALCFAFHRQPRRLRVYLDILRGRGGVTAQAAACLICFDLARQGDPRFEAEFLGLVPVVLEWLVPVDGSGSLADRLVGHNPYLQELWADLRARLVTMDPRAGEAAVELDITDADTLEVQLLDEADLAEVELDLDVVLEVDDSALRRQWAAALERFCVFNLSPQPLPDDAPDGFHAENRRDLDRIEALRQDALSLQDLPGPRGMLPVIELFLATHTRARTLLGTRNRQRDAHVVRGLEALMQLPEPPTEAIMWLTYPSAAPYAWEKVAELILDYLAFWGALPPDARAARPIHAFAQAYVDADRPQPPPPRLAEDPRARRRR